ADQEEEKSLTEQQRKFQLLGLSSATAEKTMNRKLPGSHNKMLRVRLEQDIPMLVTLPIEVQPNLANQPFPFLDTTLADLAEGEGGLVCGNQIRVKAQMPGDKQLQEVLYSTEVHTDRSFCCTGMDILPWKQTRLNPLLHTLENKARSVSKPRKEQQQRFIVKQEIKIQNTGW
uniref:Si:ch211-196f5.2 n=1 Tax=Maylandia zebra TaxID=106582 RepID=A0A3P9B0L0_9CICH